MAFVEERCLLMMEACSFQDLTVQRISKVVETLLNLESKIGGLAELLGEGAEEPAPEPVRARSKSAHGRFEFSANAKGGEITEPERGLQSLLEKRE